MVDDFKKRWRVSLSLTLFILVFSPMIQNLVWATGYNAFAIPIAAGVLHQIGFVLSPAIAAIFMSLSTVICAINTKFLRVN